MKAQNRLFTAAFVAFAILVIFNVAIISLSHNSARHRFISELDVILPEGEVLFLGNSLVEAGCLTSAFEEAWSFGAVPRSLNLALAETAPAEHSIILAKALQRIHSPKYVVYGFYDDQLIAPVSGKWDELIGNRAIAYRFPQEAASVYAPGSTLKTWQLKVGAFIPMLGERTSLWKGVERFRHVLEDVGMEGRERNQFGRVKDFARLVSVDVPSFMRRCEEAVKGKKKFSTAVVQIIRLARVHRATVVLVEMPMPEEHQALFYSSSAWSQLRAHMREQAADHGAIYLDASTWVRGEAYFDDTVHLSEKGARRFSARLAQEIPLLSTSAIASSP